MPRLFYFNPNGYGTEAFVVAENKEDAIEYLKKATEEKCLKDPSLADWFREDYQNMSTTNSNYTIDEHPIGNVVFSEIC